MANRFLSNIKINDAYTFPASDGTQGQVISTDGAGNLSFIDASSGGAPVIQKDDFVGNGVTTQFTLGQVVGSVLQTQVYMDGVYQEKETYSVANDVITFTSAPPNGVSIEVISFTSINFAGDFTVDSLQFTGGTGLQGTVTWNANEETLDLVQNGATLQLGQEIQVHVKNQTGSTIPDGTPVYVTGTLGNSGRLTVAPMIADGSIPAKFFLGVTTEDIANGEDGKVTTFGKIRGLNTSMYTEGQTLFVSASTAGAFQTTAPVSPNLDLETAIVINSHANNGTLFVRAQNGYYLGMLHDVAFSGLADKDLLVYNSTTGVWENSKTLGDITTGNITTSGTVDGVDVSAFKDAYDTHNHDDRYYTETEVDTLLTNKTNWDTAYSWGDHALAGYLTTETDPVFSASAAAGITSTQITNWDTAYGWGDHSTAGYLTSYTETDPVFSASDAAGITATDISNWDTAYGWGDHDSLYLPIGGKAADSDLLDGQNGTYYDQRRYTDSNNYLGGHYTSGGDEKPNSSAFGAGKLKVAMLGNGNLGFGGPWNDVLWMSTYTGGDVKKSTALVSSKYDNTSLWIVKQDYDSATWGTGYLFWNSGNDGSGSGLDADLLDGYHASSFLTTGSTATNVGEVRFAHTTYTDPNPGVTRDAKFGDDGIAASESYVVGISSAGGSFRAPIFYDSNDTGYYIDPTNNSRLAKLRVESAGNQDGGNIKIGGGGEASNKWSVLTGSHYNDVSESKGVMLIGSFSANGANRVVIGGDIYEANPATQIDFHTHTAATHTTGGTKVAGINNSQFYHISSVRSPIFYDNNNTGYYVDPASTSVIRKTNLVASGSGWEDCLNLFSSDATNKWNLLVDEGASNAFRIAYNSSERLNFETGGAITATGSLRAPIFYDSNDTTWYTDPASRSILNTLQLGSESSDTSNLKLDVQGNMAIRGTNGLYYGVTTNNYNSWTTRMAASGSTQYFNAQQFIFDNQGYGSSTFLTVNSNGTYANVYWDSSNTNYYVDPSDTSKLNEIVDGRGARYISKYHSGSDFPAGTLVTTDIPSGATNGASFIIEATGKSYSGNPPFSFMAQGYLYNNGIINASGVNNGDLRLTYIKVMNLGGNLAFWWPTISYWNSFEVSVRDAGGISTNRVTGITNSSEPTSATKVTQINLHKSVTYDHNTNSGELYGTVFRDANDTGYYCDPAGDSVFNRIAAKDGTDATGVSFRQPYEVISGEGWCTAHYAYNNNDGFLFLNRDSTGGTPRPTFHIGGKNNAGYAGYGSDDSIITLCTTHGTKSTGATYAGKGLSNTSYYTNIVKTTSRTIFNDAQGEHKFNGRVGIGVDGESSVGLKIQGGSNGGTAFKFISGSYASAGLIEYPFFATGLTIDNKGQVGSNGITFLKDGNSAGRITISSGSVAYITSSDYRLKENISPMTGSIDRVMSLKPIRFNMIGVEETVDGFLAHEVQDVVPEAISGQKDAIGWDGNPEYQGIDQSKLVPLLVGAIQELKAEVEALKQQLNGAN